MIRTALVGVGNCASALVQGVEYYRTNDTSQGLIIPEILGFKVSDIEFVASFDVDPQKVGQPLGKAILSGQNNTLPLSDSVETTCMVYAAPVFDTIGLAYRAEFEPVAASEQDTRAILAESKPDVLVNYLPVGSDEATQYWAQICLDLKIGFINAIPSFVVSDSSWNSRFIKAGVPCAGDDVKSQIGATIIHRALVETFSRRGGKLTDTYQLNFGGNMDFKNMIEGERLTSKRISKVNSVLAAITDSSLRPDQIHISPTDYVSYLKDNKIAYVNIRGTGFAGAPIEIETKLSVWDSPNSAAVVVDVIRFIAGAKATGTGGALPICDFYFKSPPQQENDIIAETKAREYADRGT